ncbi:MAG TPA: bifunctional UDP-N-acetylglucosamine diphosphorylase/glucosamine-1-phosphate N-acetyltransferase GlmU [Verrucomicrobiae bacterium]|nr:bifunctional UDP-N-acetylglucosamine diphosphorylase/glucosamine-1-phosphate N-acetyltransferase GlmU [Verrucomicrobiae bacterium]
MAARVVILAAGRGTRMRSQLPKVLHPACGLPLIDWVLEAARDAGPLPPVVVVAPGAQALRQHLEGRATVVEQPEPRGTGDAVRAARPLLAGDDPVVVLYGDVPLLRSETVRRLLDRFEAGGVDAVLLTAMTADPTGYGRVLRDPEGAFVRVVEEPDLPALPRPDPGPGPTVEVNTGAYVFAPAALWDALDRLGSDNAQQEIYLTDAPARLGRVATVELGDPEEMLGVNDRVQLAAAAASLRRRVLTRLMRSGVTVEDPATTYVDAGVEVGPDSVLRPGSVLAGRTRLGRACVVGPFAQLEDTEAGDRCRIATAHLAGCRLGDGVTIGPFNRIRPGSVLEDHSRLGTFTEVARSRVGPHSLVPHLTYLGDATLGRDVNVGAGTITANWDGRDKHATVIGDGARVGSDTILVAPVTVGAGAYTGAGSVITRDVPAGSLGLARARQRTLLGWVARRAGRRAPASRDNGEARPPARAADRTPGGEPG